MDSNNKRENTQLVFHWEKGRGKKTEERRATRPKRGGPTRPQYLTEWDPPSGASSTSSPGAFYARLRPPQKVMP